MLQTIQVPNIDINNLLNLNRKQKEQIIVILQKSLIISEENNNTEEQTEEEKLGLLDCFQGNWGEGADSLQYANSLRYDNVENHRNITPWR